MWFSKVKQIRNQIKKEICDTFGQSVESDIIFLKRCDFGRYFDHEIRSLEKEKDDIIRKLSTDKNPEEYPNDFIYSIFMVKDKISKLANYLKVLIIMDKKLRYKRQHNYLGIGKIFQRKNEGCFFCELYIANIYDQLRTNIIIDLYDNDFDSTKIEYCIIWNMNYGMLNIAGIRIPREFQGRGYGTAIFNLLDELVILINKSVDWYKCMGIKKVGRAEGIISPGDGISRDNLIKFYKSVDYFKDDKLYKKY
jgi:hypothetical protein